LDEEQGDTGKLFFAGFQMSLTQDQKELGSVESKQLDIL
jgi:hypothetical protein